MHLRCIVRAEVDQVASEVFCWLMIACVDAVQSQTANCGLVWSFRMGHPDVSDSIQNGSGEDRSGSRISRWIPIEQFGA